MSDEYRHVSNWIHWHLTPQGWVQGTAKDENDERYEKPIPEDRVLTLSHGSEGSEIRGKSVATKSIWQTDDSALIERLKKEFGAKPASFW